VRFRVLAIDGALNNSGWVLLDEVESDSGKRIIKASKYGILSPNAKMSLGFKLDFIRKELIKMVKSFKPNVVVFEDTYSGRNAMTNARLNNAKGVFIVTVFELMGEDPVYVSAAIARSCLGFGNNKEDPYEYFSKELKLTETFAQGNDITDAYTLGFWYLAERRGDCKERKKKVKRPRRVKKIG
jgi:Holliday junction resolvasome RuvABC endonuclease subunit